MKKNLMFFVLGVSTTLVALSIMLSFFCFCGCAKAKPELQRELEDSLLALDRGDEVKIVGDVLTSQMIKYGCAEDELGVVAKYFMLYERSAEQLRTMIDKFLDEMWVIKGILLGASSSDMDKTMSELQCRVTVSRTEWEDIYKRHLANLQMVQEITRSDLSSAKRRAEAMNNRLVQVFECAEKECDLATKGSKPIPEGLSVAELKKIQARGAEMLAELKALDKKFDSLIKPFLHGSKVGGVRNLYKMEDYSLTEEEQTWPLL